jgi:type III secretion system FlhB-like substrate exporter
MSNVALLKGAAHIVGALGVQKVVGDIIKNNTVVVSTADKLLVSTGSLVLGSMIGEQTTKHIAHVFSILKEPFNNDNDDTTPNT